MDELDLGVEICGVRMPNPTVLASGILGLSSEVFERLARSGLGAITTKSVSLQPRPGYKNPVIVDYGPGLINAVGLSNPGVEVMVDEIRRATNGNFALGNERFAEQVAAALGRRVVPGRSGRPRKAVEVESGEMFGG